MQLTQAFNGFIQNIVQNLGRSPFRQMVDYLTAIPYLTWFNWFFPVSECMAVGAIWLAAIALFYTWMVIARWVKLVAD